MVNRICKNCKYYKQIEIMKTDEYLDMVRDYKQECKKGYNAYYDKIRCSHFEYKNGFYRFLAKVEFKLYKIYAKIKGIDIIIEEGDD